jgi:GntP family gluconate:H+ symporter
MLGMSHDATLLFNAVIAILALILMITRLRIHPSSP